MSTYLQILLVEDEMSTIELLREALSEGEREFDLRVCTDGEEALKQLEWNTIKPHVILLDLNLPGKSGLDVLREIKSNDSIRHIPVIILTNSRSPNDVLKAYAAQCNAYIRKPMGFEALLDVVEATGKFWFEVATLPEEESTLHLPSVPPPDFS